MPTTDPIEQLVKLRWVAEAVKETNGYKVRTREHVFTTLLTHHVIAGGSSYDYEFTKGSRLAKTVRVELPEYWVHLDEFDFFFSLVHPPQKAVRNVIGIIPQYQNLQPVGSYDKKWQPCYGTSSEQHDGRSTRFDYGEAKEWTDRAIQAVIYLQSALPHYGETWYSTAFAYRLGIVGDEFNESVPKNAVVAGTTEPATEQA